jgi:peptidoglycan/LPS O-acetylase OafA/YrhL
VYLQSYVSCPIGIHMVGFVMATHGATAAAFIFLFSRLAKLTGRYPLFAIAALTSLVSLIILYDWTPTADEEALIYVFPVLWGVGEGVWQAQTNGKGGKSFP